jgi:hypothetical protein
MQQHLPSGFERLVIAAGRDGRALLKALSNKQWHEMRLSRDVSTHFGVLS